MLALCNKSDLPAAFDPEELAGLCDGVLCVSARDGDLAGLEGVVKEWFTNGELTVGEDAILTSARQYAVLFRAHERLCAAAAALACDGELDAAVCELEGALGELGECDGRAVTQDVVDRIFAAFCVGK